MDEEIRIISENTRKEKFLKFFINNKKKIYLSIFVLILIFFIFFLYMDFLNKKKIKIADKFLNISINYNKDNKDHFAKELKAIIFMKDRTYSPLALFYIIDNNVIESKEEINNFFFEIIQNVKLESEIINLLLYKKALFNSEFSSEIELIEILKPIINSESIWKPHALFLLGDFFLSRGEVRKAKEFYNNVLILKNLDENIKYNAAKKIKEN